HRGRLRRALAFDRHIGRLDGWLLRHRLLRVGVIALFVAASVAGTIFLIPPVDFLPKGNRNIVFGILNTPPGYSIDQNFAINERVEEIVAPYWEISETPVEELRPVPAGFEPGAP